jgi:hypothetical protein
MPSPVLCDVVTSYDGASQLAGMTYSLGQTALGNLTYSYHSLGRRNSMGGSFARTGLPLAVKIKIVLGEDLFRGL